MKKPKLAWHQITANCWKTTFGQSKMTATVSSHNRWWMVTSVCGVPGNGEKHIDRESAQVAAEKLAVEYTRKLLNFWVSL
jgi:hypothetical protein